MAGYRLTVAARADLRRIFVESIELFGPTQARAYRDRIGTTFALIAQQPGMARLRRELEPSVRVHPVGAHFVVYIEQDDSVLILRIRHGREDWQNDPVG